MKYVYSSLICCVGLFFAALAPASATVYYLNHASGSDQAAGTSAATAWKSLAKAGSTVKSSDSVVYQSVLGWTLTIPGVSFEGLPQIFSPVTQLTKVAPGFDITQGAGNCCTSDGATTQSMLNFGHLARIQQTGNATEIEFAWNKRIGPGTIQALYFQVWRRNGATFDRVGQAQIETSLLREDQVNRVRLNVPIPVREGDYTGFRTEYTGGPANQLTISYISGMNGRYIVGTAPAATAFDWLAQPSVPGAAIAVGVYVDRAPVFIATGDSLMTGAPFSFSYADVAGGIYPSDDSSGSPAVHVAARLGTTFQNAGRWGKTTTELTSVYAQNVYFVSPKIVLLEGGMNDIRSSPSLGNLLSNYGAILDANRSAGIISIVALIQPCTAANSNEMSTRDNWNVAIRSLAESYGALLFDPNPYIGQARAGGPANNTWDFKPPYGSPDAFHLSVAGAERYSEAVMDAIAKVLAGVK